MTTASLPIQEILAHLRVNLAQTAVAQGVTDACGSYPVYRGPLGTVLSEDGTTFYAWSPSCEQIVVRLYTSDDPHEQCFQSLPLEHIEDGAWMLATPTATHETYYDYVVVHELPDDVVQSLPSDVLQALATCDATSNQHDLLGDHSIQANHCTAASGSHDSSKQHDDDVLAELDILSTLKAATDSTGDDALLVQHNGHTYAIMITADPWATASGANGKRSMVVDMEQTHPDAWEADKSAPFDPRTTVIWETHVGDFSNDPHSGISSEHRGKFLAFCDETPANRGLNYVASLGVTHVQLMPIYDYGSVDELVSSSNSTVSTNDLITATNVSSAGNAIPSDNATGNDGTKPTDSTAADGIASNSDSADSPSPDSSAATQTPQYNWGYDPISYNVPEGSYSTNPHDGATRIRECKAMIAAIHAKGLRVIMDVVYNHMYTSDNAFERLVPSYFCRTHLDGTLAQGSGCGNDMASERPMFSRFIVDSLLWWAREYHIDGFRFDLMGLLDTDTLNQARASLDALPDGKAILMFGEPWRAQDTHLAIAKTLADHAGTKQLNAGVGWFCDQTRDAIKGHVWYHQDSGWVNGQPHKYSQSVNHSHNAWRGTYHAPQSVYQLIQYVSSHDDLTLWDKLCATMRKHPSHDDYDTRNLGGQTRRKGLVRDCGDIVRANAIAAGLILTAAGTPFMLSGEEFARTKYGCDNSFDKPAELNQLDWLKADRLGDSLVAWYRDLIALRHAHPKLSSADRERIASPHDMLAIQVASRSDKLIVCANPTEHEGYISLPFTTQWHVALDSRRYVGAYKDDSFGVYGSASTLSSVSGASGAGEGVDSAGQLLETFGGRSQFGFGYQLHTENLASLNTDALVLPTQTFIVYRA